MAEENNKKKVHWKDMKKALRLFAYIKPFWFLFSLGFIFLVITSLAALAFPKLLSMLMASTPENLSNNLWLLIFVLGIQAVASFFRIVTFVQVTEKSLAHIRQDVYSQLIQLPMSFFSEKRVGELNSRISSDTAQIQETMTTTLAQFFRQMAMVLGGIIILAVTSVKLTLFIIAVVPTLMLAAVFFGRFIRRYAKKVQEEIADSNTIVEETLQGIQTVKAFVNEWFEIGRYRKMTDSVARTAIKGGIYRGSFASFIIVGIFGAIVAVIWFAVGMIHNGELQENQLAEFLLYAVFIGGSVGGLAGVYTNIQKTIGATEDLFEILDIQKENVSTSAPSKLPDFSGSIGFDQVTFCYPSRKDVEVLKGISFTINKGEQVALVGPSGAGKSTIIQLIMQFYQPDKGTLFFDGKPATAYTLSAIRHQMAIVPQDVLLFGGTIRENIAYGDTRADMEQIMEAAKKANADDFIRAFPDGYDTVVGERGIQLSGGQRQRIAIARAVLKNPRILLLDEATSSLDSESEKLVQQALEKLMEGRTSLVIAHRLSTIINADKILVIDGGKIVEEGTHYELLARDNGRYRQLSEMQLVG
ncbi:MAG: ABC transporter transmembrane domain-containing protein [bacterium]|jgi:ABC-type multidrug transport system fused ATPase/permease subunit